MKTEQFGQITPVKMKKQTDSALSQAKVYLSPSLHGRVRNATLEILCEEKRGALEETPQEPPKAFSVDTGNRDGVWQWAEAGSTTNVSPSVIPHPCTLDCAVAFRVGYALRKIVRCGS